MMTCPAMVPVKSSSGPTPAAPARTGWPPAPSGHRLQQAVGLVDIEHAVVARLVERGRRQHQDGAVDQQGQQQRHHCIDARQADACRLAWSCFATTRVCTTEECR
jgi:hypothetical protein